MISDTAVPATPFVVEKRSRFFYDELLCLIVAGKKDIIFPTINSYLLQQHLPDAQLIIYPDSNHGMLYQFQEDFVQHASRFLNR